MLTTDDPQADHYLRLRRRLAEGSAADAAAALADIAREVRRTDLAMIRRAGLGHIGSDFSVIDILVTLYGAVLSVDPRAPLAPDRDRLILSKGHTAGALYAVLAQFGFFPRSALETFAGPLSPLNGHPNRTKVPGVETNTGPLGHGFPVAVGVALAHRLRGSRSRTFVVLGDGELQEGSNWEAAMTAGHHGLSALTAVVDRNRLQQGARTEETKQLEPLADKWRSFGWDVRECDGHDHGRLLAAFTEPAGDRPVCVIAHTTKGKGVSFMEDRVEWHHKVPSAEQAASAFEELAR
ncbi:transketolase [Actinomadura sp. K4S16]|uniref:transketolase n=1 Tax=Actinomadura sp. K4S16 TaxID=1316147 RepID=UPI0011EF4C11|nr:transketolase [Actinomadura sp. K4S16]